MSYLSGIGRFRLPASAANYLAARVLWYTGVRIEAGW
jgi:hypothetical protein